jgi:hypothetical protein
VSDVRLTGRRAIVGCAALLSLAGTGQLEAGLGGDVAGAAPPSARIGPSHLTIECPMATSDEVASTRHNTPKGQRPSAEREAHLDGNLTVAIPATVYVRVKGRRLVVTTNTGEHPQPGDAYYLVSPGKAEPADPALQKEVLTACAPTSGWPSHPGPMRTPAPLRGRSASHAATRSASTDVAHRVPGAGPHSRRQGAARDH